MAYNTFGTVNDIITGVSQDVRNLLSAQTGTAGQTVLIDYTNRIHKQMLRRSRWGFLRSTPLFFITSLGQSSYWVGPTGTGPAGVVDTALNLSDMFQVKKDSVYDIANKRNIKWLADQPLGPNLTDNLGSARPGLPATFRQDLNNPNIIQIFPAPNNQNTAQPVPQVPVVTTVAGGALPTRTYLLKVTFVDSLGGESTSTTVGAPLFITANNLAQVKSPATGWIGVLPDGANVSGVQYNRYNVYAVQATLSNGVITNEGAEVLQTASPISIGTDWTEPLTGLIAGVSPPTKNTLQPVGSYPMKFEYFKNRIKLVTPGQSLQVPDDYNDVIIAGVTALAFKLMGKAEEAKIHFDLYMSGLTEMIADKNLFPEGIEYIRPDSNSYVNTQILGYLDPFF